MFLTIFTVTLEINSMEETLAAIRHFSTSSTDFTNFKLQFVPKLLETILYTEIKFIVMKSAFHSLLKDLSNFASVNHENRSTVIPVSEIQREMATNFLLFVIHRISEFFAMTSLLCLFSKLKGLFGIHKVKSVLGNHLQ